MYCADDRANAEKTHFVRDGSSMLCDGGGLYECPKCGRQPLRHNMGLMTAISQDRGWGAYQFFDQSKQAFAGLHQAVTLMFQLGPREQLLR